MSGSPLDEGVLRMLLGESSDDGMGMGLYDSSARPLASLQVPSTNPSMPGSRIDAGLPQLSSEEQLQLLRHQLEQQQHILNSLQQQQRLGPGFGKAMKEGKETHASFSRSANSNGARRAARKVATEKHRAQVAELEGRLSSISSIHCALTAENGMLRRRMLLLESGVQMREQHIEALLRGRLQQQHEQQQQQQQPRLPENVDAALTPVGVPSRVEASASGQGEASVSGRESGAWVSFGHFPDPKSWSSDTCR